MKSNEEIIAEWRKNRSNTFAFLRDSDYPANARKLMLDSERNVVYFFYGDNEELLYVGRSNNFSLRWRQHLQSDKDMMQIRKVCLHIFETKPETIFYEAQQIAMLKPLWNIVGVDSTVAKNMIAPLEKAWFECRLTATEEESEEILKKMELLHTSDWFVNKTDEQLKEEFYHIHRLQQHETVFHPLEPKKEKEEPLPPDSPIYKIIKKKSKDKRNLKRVVHIWQGRDTLCGMVRTNKLKPENYWFSDVKKLPKDLCPYCESKLNAN